MKKTKLTKAQFKRIALEVFERDSYLCQYCNRPKSEYMDAIHCHHRVFKSQGGDDAKDNLATVCFKCHYDHGSLKNKKLITEKDNSTMKKLRDRYITNSNFKARYDKL